MKKIWILISLFIIILMFLSPDVLKYLSRFIENNRDKCRFMMTCKKISICEFYFNGQVYLDLIEKSRWFNRFTNICIRNKVRIKLPPLVTHLTVHCEYSIKNIPPTVTHLNLSSYFKGKINNIPPSVTILILTWYPYQFDLIYIPQNVTHLVFHYQFNQSINNLNLPKIEYLMFGCNFNQPIDNCIPSSIKCLKFGTEFNQPIKGCIPSSVTHLTFGRRFNQPLKDCIPTSVVKLVFNGTRNPEQINYIKECVKEHNLELCFNE